MCIRDRYEQYTEYVPIGKTLSRAALGKWIKLRLRNVDTIIAPTKKVESVSYTHLDVYKRQVFGMRRGRGRF